MSPSRVAPAWVWSIAEILDLMRLETRSPGWDVFLALTAPWYGSEPWGEATDTEARIRVAESIDAWVRDEPAVARPFLEQLVDNRLWPFPPRDPQQLIGPVVAEPVGALL